MDADPIPFWRWLGLRPLPVGQSQDLWLGVATVEKLPRDTTDNKLVVRLSALEPLSSQPLLLSTAQRLRGETLRDWSKNVGGEDNDDALDADIDEELSDGLSQISLSGPQRARAARASYQVDVDGFLQAAQRGQSTNALDWRAHGCSPTLSSDAIRLSIFDGGVPGGMKVGDVVSVVVQRRPRPPSKAESTGRPSAAAKASSTPRNARPNEGDGTPRSEREQEQERDAFWSLFAVTVIALTTRRAAAGVRPPVETWFDELQAPSSASSSSYNTNNSSSSSAAAATAASDGGSDALTRWRKRLWMIDACMAPLTAAWAAACHQQDNQQLAQSAVRTLLDIVTPPHTDPANSIIAPELVPTSADWACVARIMSVIVTHQPSWALFTRVLSASVGSPPAGRNGRAAVAGSRASGDDEASQAVLDLLGVAVERCVPQVLVVTIQPPGFSQLLQRLLANGVATTPRASTAMARLFTALARRIPIPSSLRPLTSSASQQLLATASHRLHWLQVPLVPTSADLLSPAWLQHPNLPGLKRASDGHYASPQKYLEALFRLQRADGLRGITEGVSALGRGEKVDERDLEMYDSVQLVGFKVLGSTMQAAVTFKPRRKVKDLAKSGRLMDGSLIAISTNGTFAPSSLLWAVVAPGCDKLLAHNAVILDVLYDGDATEGLAAVRTLLESHRSSQPVRMVESPAFFTSVRYALQRLQLLGRQRALPGAPPIPFEAELVYLGAQQQQQDGDGSSSAATRYALSSSPYASGALAPAAAASGGMQGSLASASASAFEQPQVDPLPKSLFSPPTPSLRNLDLSSLASNYLCDLEFSQREGVSIALRQRLTCVQGPPGTGKTYTSATLARILLELPPGQRPTTPVLMLAVKNHALDSFLSRFLDRYPDRVARVGGKAETEALAALNLSVLRQEAADKARAASFPKQPKSGAGGAAASPAMVASNGVSRTLKDAYHARGKARAALLGIEGLLRDVLAGQSGSGGLSLATLCAHATSEQLQSLVRLAPDVGSLTYPQGLPGDSLGSRYAAAVARNKETVRRADLGALSAFGDDDDADVTTSGDGTGGGGGGRTGLVSAPEGVVDVGSAIIGLLSSPLHFSDEELNAAEWTVPAGAKGKKGKKKQSPHIPSPLEALRDVVHVWASDITNDVRSMFHAPGAAAGGGAPDTGAAAALLQVRTGSSAAADDSDEVDAEAVEAVRAERMLDDDDDDDANAGPLPVQSAPGRASAAPAGASTAAASGRASGLSKELLSELDRMHVQLTGTDDAALPTGNASDPLFRVRYAALAYAPGYQHLIEGDNSAALQQLYRTPNLWDLDPQQRAIFLHKLSLEAKIATDRQREALMPSLRQASRAYDDARLDFDAAVLASKAIIGMTINGAAKYSSLLARLNVTVVIVEEAAEVTEPLLIAALPSTTQLLYMAGDHKQLPPQPESHILAKHPFNLELSLFERLVNAGFPHGRLTLQNRMRPQLAELIRVANVYAQYSDRARLDVDRPLLRHLPLTSVFWWCHNEPEDGAALTSQGGKPKRKGVDGDDDDDAEAPTRWAVKAAAAGGSGGGRSKSHEGEAKRAVAVARWHMINGVHPSRIAIIAAYAGQVTRIRSLLRAPGAIPADVIDHARTDLPQGVAPAPAPASAPASAVAATAARSGGTTATGSGSGGNNTASAGGLAPQRPATAAGAANAAAPAPARQQQKLQLRSSPAEQRLPRVCTVDEFQGDEADAIILSLVRKNSNGAIGFLKKVNRLTVALSRARCSLVILGADRHMANNSPDWRRIVEHLTTHDALGPALPLLCSRHGSELKCAVQAADVPASFAASLLCKRSCDVMMPCGHKCADKCHPDDPSHAKRSARCKEQVNLAFPACGHRKHVNCCDSTAAATGLMPTCSMPCGRKLKLCGHPCQEECGKPCSDVIGVCSTCAAIAELERRAELERKLLEREAILQQVQAQLERLTALSASDTALSTPRRQRLSLDDHDVLGVIDRVMSSIQPGHKFGLVVTDVENVSAPHLDTAMYSAVQDMHQPQLPTQSVSLYHGTRVANVDSILAGGFRVSAARNTAAGASHAVNMLGAAVYLARDSSKAAREEYTGGDGEGVLLVCDALLGSVKEALMADASMSSPEARNAGKYDSAFLRRNGHVRYDEYAVFDVRRVVPRYVVHFKRVGMALRPPPALAAKEANKAPIRQEGGASWYKITAEDAVKGSLVGDWLALEFTIAQTLYTQLSGPGAGKLKMVTVCINPLLERQYEAARRVLERRGLPTEERGYFHGTDTKNHVAIQREGFRIGGVDGHGTAHGVAMGHGVYLGDMAEVSRDYVIGEDAMLLCRVLPGQRSPVPFGANQCSRELWPVEKEAAQSYEREHRGGKALILASSTLALPRYVVHY